MAVSQGDPVFSSKYGENGRYKKEFREKVTEFASLQGVSNAAAEFGVPQSRVTRWLRIHRREQSGLPSTPGAPVVGNFGLRNAAKRLMRSNRFTGLPRHEKKAVLSAALLDLAAELMDRLTAPVKENRVAPGGRVVEVENPRPTANETKDLLLALAVATDKSILLAGEATSRHEHVDVTELEVALNDAIKDPVKRRLLAAKVLGGADPERSKPALPVGSSVTTDTTTVRPLTRSARRRAERDAGL